MPSTRPLAPLFVATILIACGLTAAAVVYWTRLSSPDPASGTVVLEPDEVRLHVDEETAVATAQRAPVDLATRRLEARVATLEAQLREREQRIADLELDLNRSRASRIGDRLRLAIAEDGGAELDRLLREVAEGDKWLSVTELEDLTRRLEPAAVVDALVLVRKLHGDLTALRAEKMRTLDPDALALWRRNDLPSAAREMARETVSRLRAIGVPGYLTDRVTTRIAEVYGVR